MIRISDDRIYVTHDLCGLDCFSIDMPKENTRFGEYKISVLLPDGTMPNLADDARCGSCNELIGLDEFIPIRHLIESLTIRDV